VLAAWSRNNVYRQKPHPFCSEFSANRFVRSLRGGSAMDQVCLVLPILANKTEDARAFQRELDTERKADYDRSERRIGITKEVWYIASLPGGDQLVAYLETPDIQRALKLFVESRDEFDEWFKRRLADVTGVDMNNLPPDMQLPELVSRYEA
jgi:hypothetical protein